MVGPILRSWAAHSRPFIRFIAIYFDLQRMAIRATLFINVVLKDLIKQPNIDLKGLLFGRGNNMKTSGMLWHLVLAVICSITLIGIWPRTLSVSAEETGVVYIGRELDKAELRNGDTITYGNGSASYQDGILTLANATIENSWIFMDDDDSADLTINLIGQNSINRGGIDIMGGNLTITGDGTLSIYSPGDAINGRHVWIQDCGGVTIDTDGEGIITWYTLHSDGNGGLTGNRKQSYLTVKNSVLDITCHSKKYRYEAGIFANYIDIVDSKVTVACDNKIQWGIGTRDRITISGNSEVIVSNGFGHHSEDNPSLSIDGAATIKVSDSLDGSDAFDIDGSPFSGPVSISDQDFDDLLYRAYVHINCERIESEPSVAESSSSPCHHNYEWEIYKEATATTDGIMRYRCKYCGSVEYEVPTAAYYVFNKETQDSIKNAALNETVTISTPVFISIHEMVKDALVERPDVTLVLDYKNNGKIYEMTIPAGSGNTLDTLFGDNQYAGFLYLGGTFATIEK